jgi:hypothetical protein
MRVIAGKLLPDYMAQQPRRQPSKYELGQDRWIKNGVKAPGDKPHEASMLRKARIIKFWGFEAT